jgi:hypothetical protein
MSLHLIDPKYSSPFHESFLLYPIPSHLDISVSVDLRPYIIFQNIQSGPNVFDHFYN